MARIIAPPTPSFDSLRNPLTEGERKVIEMFDERLSPQWELYVQPHLNGLRPDLVALHPEVGLGVFEIKDWDLNAIKYSVERDEDAIKLIGIDALGERFERPDPVSKIVLYQEETASLYCPRLDAKAGIAVITAGMIFTQSSRDQVHRLLAPLRQRHEGMRKYPKYFPLAGMEDVEQGRLAALFPEHSRTYSKFMNADVAEDLRGWLREPDHSHQQRVPLELDERQRELVNSRTASGYRRIRGPAGTGKSLVLAARASALAQEGKRVLVVTYNITLKNYLRDLAARHARVGSKALKHIDFLNFHFWCKRCCLEAGWGDQYKALWKSLKTAHEDDPHLDSSDDPSAVLNEQLAELVQRVFKWCGGHRVPTRYDAIVVDEGQDFRLSWWNALRKALLPGGEMVLAADRTQDIYETASAWTEEAMVGSGFSGPWTELKNCYRIPAPLIDLVRRFTAEFMADKDIDAPTALRGERQLEFGDERARLRWVQVATPDLLTIACADEVVEMLKRLTTSTSVSDIVILAPTQQIGTAVVAAIDNPMYNIKMHHTFDSDKRVARKKKLAFFKGDARVKATTLHSFKGWETPHLIVVVDTIDRPDSPALLFTAMTRLRRAPHGSCLTVVSACPDLRTFGSSWPEFEEPRLSLPCPSSDGGGS